MTCLWKTTSVSVLLLAAACVLANPALLSTDECLDEISWADPTNCSRYYVCAPWGPEIMDCALGTHYNPELKVCDWPETVGCVVSTTSTEAPATSPAATPSQPPPTEPPTTEAPTTEAPSTAAPSTEVPSTEAPEEPTGTPEEPTETTELPTAPTVEAATPEEPTGTTESEPETTDPTTEAEPTTEVEPESTTEGEPEPTTDAEPESTTEEPEPTTEEEPEPTTEEPEPTTEEEPEPTTEEEPEPTTTPVTTTTEGKTPQDICAEFPNLFFVTSYPNDCTRFIACNYGDPNIFECPEGNYFSPILSTCIADPSHCA